ncbi:hypothetical protein M513_09775 [Trichuris suis]|uniref:Uncharacterized protein n=1 Tax=Trichuris suis TaxID=68888 RepID=A0A085LWI2_9BILA|nr:hypothetical protein M513_09775 [Trichuris suis]
MKLKWMQKLSFLLETTCSPPTAAFCDVKDNAKEDSTECMPFKPTELMVIKCLDVTCPQVVTIDTSNSHMRRRTKENITSPHYTTHHLYHKRGSVDFTLPAEDKMETFHQQGNSRASARYRCTSMNSEDRGALLYEQLVLCSNRKKKLPYVLTCSCAKWKHLPWTEPLRGMKNGISTMTGNIEPSATNVGKTKTYSTQLRSLQPIKRIQRISEKIAITILKESSLFAV